FLLKTSFKRCYGFRIAAAQDLRLNQLDRGGPCKQSMFSPPHLTHTATSEQFDELVTSQFACLRHVRSQGVNETRQNDCDHGAHHVWKQRNHKHIWGRRRLVVRISHDNEPECAHQRRAERCQCRFTQSVWDDENEERNP